jgi:putative permease
MPLVLSTVFTLLLSPIVHAMQRAGYPKTASIGILFLTIGTIGVFASIAISQTLISQWDGLSRDTPRYIEQSTQKLISLERTFKSRYPVLQNITLVDSLIRFGKETVLWSVQNIPSIVGEFLTWIFLVPIFVFVFLKDGDYFRKQIYQLVPNRYFESTFMITSKVIDSTSDYVRAKLIEALLVGVLTGFGLWVLGAPYSLVLGVVAGVTNIVPYVGPVLGAVPGVVMALADPSFSAFLWPSVMVYVLVNGGMISGLLPVVGVPMPFISYGGTAMVTLGLGLGILMSISKSRRLVQT